MLTGPQKEALRIAYRDGVVFSGGGVRLATIQALVRAGLLIGKTTRAQEQGRRGVRTGRRARWYVEAEATLTPAGTNIASVIET